MSRKYKQDLLQECRNALDEKLIFSLVYKPPVTLSAIQCKTCGNQLTHFVIRFLKASALETFLEMFPNKLANKVALYRFETSGLRYQQCQKPRKPCLQFLTSSGYTRLFENKVVGGVVTVVPKSFLHLLNVPLMNVSGACIEIGPDLFVNVGIGNSLKVSQGMKKRIDNSEVGSSPKCSGIYHMAPEYRTVNDDFGRFVRYEKENRLTFTPSNVIFKPAQAPLVGRLSKQGKRTLLNL